MARGPLALVQAAITVAIAASLLPLHRAADPHRGAAPRALRVPRFAAQPRTPLALTTGAVAVLLGLVALTPRASPRCRRDSRAQALASSRRASDAPRAAARADLSPRPPPSDLSAPPGVNRTPRRASPPASGAAPDDPAHRADPRRRRLRDARRLNRAGVGARARAAHRRGRLAPARGDDRPALRLSCRGLAAASRDRPHRRQRPRLLRRRPAAQAGAGRRARWS